MANYLRTLGQAVKFTFDNHIPWTQRDEDGKYIKGAASAYYAIQPWLEIFGRSYLITSIDTAAVERLKTTLYKRGKSNRTINLAIQSMQTCLTYCAKLKKISQSDLDWKSCKLPKDALVRLHYEPEQVHELVTASRKVFRDDALADIIICAFSTGLRQGELLKLRVRDINFLDNTLISGARKDREHKTDRRKARDVVHIPISAWLLPILQERCRDMPGTALIFAEDFNCDRHNLYRRFDAVKNYCGFIEEGYCFHSLRHSFGTYQFRIGTSSRDLMSMMGHALIQTTLGYSHSTDEQRQNAIKKMDESLPWLNPAAPHVPKIEPVPHPPRVTKVGSKLHTDMGHGVVKVDIFNRYQ